MGKGHGKKHPAKPIETDPAKLAIPLLSYATAYAASIGWKVNESVVARGQGVEDIVQDALASMLSTDGATVGEGARKRWNPEETPDPMDYLRSFVNSRLSTLVRSYEKRNRRAVDPEAHAADDDPGAEVVERDLDPWRDRARDLLLAHIIDDPLLVRMYDLLETEDLEHKPSKVAERLGVTVGEVKAAVRRFNLIRAKVMDQLNAELVGPRGGGDA